MPPARLDPPPSPWDADDRSLFVPVSRMRSLLTGRLGACLAAILTWRRRWTP